MSKSIKAKLVRLYGKKCWLFSEISRNNKLTYHHIDPVRQEGDTSLGNGALLTKRMHMFFNELEKTYPIIANELNYYFFLYKGEYPDYVELKIKEILEDYYRAYKPIQRQRKHDNNK